MSGNSDDRDFRRKSGGMDSTKRRIVEIGERPLFRTYHPESTCKVSTSARLRPEPGELGFGLSAVLKLRRMAAEGKVDLVVCHPELYAPWRPRSIFPALGRSLPRDAGGLLRTFGHPAVRLLPEVPLAVVDLADSFVIGRHNFFLLDRCRLYFKRELPVDRWRVFFGTGHPNLPTRRIRLNPRFQRRIARLRPISLGVPDSTAALARPVAEKTADVFFAGQVAPSSTVRTAGLAQLVALRGEGYRIDIATEPLPLEAYLERCARAWLTWSPEGFGWECHRHYEAPLCGSVPVMSRPTIERYRPLAEGKHGFYYDVEGDDLALTLRAALADRERLVRMAQAARAHVLAHHTHARLCDYILESCLEGGPAD